jgi:hypothetical protein
MKTQQSLLRIAGFINLSFVAFHLAFYKLFHWSADLSLLLAVNKAIFLTYHCISILMLFFMAFVSLLQTKTLLESKLKYSILGLFILFFSVRIVAEFLFFGIKPSTPVILSICLVPIVLYAIPLFNNRQTVQQ